MWDYSLFVIDNVLFHIYQTIVDNLTKATSYKIQKAYTSLHINIWLHSGSA